MLVVEKYSCQVQWFIFQHDIPQSAVNSRDLVPEDSFALVEKVAEALRDMQSDVARHEVP